MIKYKGKPIKWKNGANTEHFARMIAECFFILLYCVQIRATACNDSEMFFNVRVYKYLCIDQLKQLINEHIFVFFLHIMFIVCIINIENNINIKNKEKDKRPNDK